ncbi:uncharacterized protein ACO6RY_06024 [Pungitius sinensis]
MNGWGWEVRVVRVSPLIGLSPPAPPASPPPPLRRPLGSVWLIKEREEMEAGSKHGAVCLGRLPSPGRGSGQRAAPPSSRGSSPSLCLPGSVRPPPLLPLPCGKPFCGDETAGLLGPAGWRIRIRLAGAGWQMAA